MSKGIKLLCFVIWIRNNKKTRRRRRSKNVATQTITDACPRARDKYHLNDKKKGNHFDSPLCSDTMQRMLLTKWRRRRKRKEQKGKCLVMESKQCDSI